MNEASFRLPCKQACVFEGCAGFLDRRGGEWQATGDEWRGTLGFGGGKARA